MNARHNDAGLAVAPKNADFIVLHENAPVSVQGYSYLYGLLALQGILYGFNKWGVFNDSELMPSCQFGWNGRSLKKLRGRPVKSDPSKTDVRGIGCAGGLSNIHHAPVNLPYQFLVPAWREIFSYGWLE